MKKSLIPLITAAIAFSPVIHADEYEYTATPEPVQRADLLDEDGDGVINERDLCPQTPLHADIDNDGCGTYIKSQQEMSLHILFDNDSSDVQPYFLVQVREMAAFLTQYPSTSIELQGYASKVGNPEYNMELSKQRANSVREALQNNGILSNRIRIVGFGDSQLEDSGDSQLAHARNRKVVATVVGHKGNVKEEWTIFTKIEK